MAAQEVGAKVNGAIYDGSWEEWKKRRGPMAGEHVEEEEEEEGEEEKAGEGAEECKEKKEEKKKKEGKK